MKVSPIFWSGLAAGSLTALLIISGMSSGDVRAHGLSTSGSPAADPIVIEIQQELARLGYDPGPADGLIGNQTREAIRAFQRDVGQPVTGEVNEGVAELLRTRSARAQALAATKPGELLPTSVAPPATAPELGNDNSLSGTTWKFWDDSGAEFTVTFGPDGRVNGPAFSRGWKWQQEGAEVELTYDNHVGGRATRKGRLVSGEEMAGMGESSRGEEWAWNASRLR